MNLSRRRVKTPQERFRRPEIILQELLRKYSKGQISDNPLSSRLFLRAVVLAVDNVGGKLSNPSGQGSITSGGNTYDALVGPTNPPGSIKAKLISKGLDRFFEEKESKIFWPFFPTDHLSLPIKPEEHVFIMFEDDYLEHGFWFCRVSGQDDPNFFKGQDSFVSDTTITAMDTFEAKDDKKITDDFATDSVERKNLNEIF